MLPANPMKILILATDAYGGYGGIAQYNRDFVEAICETNKHALVELLVRSGTASQDEIPSNAVQLKPVNSRVGYSALAISRALKFKPDIIVSGHLYHGPLAVKIAKLTGARLVSQLHGTEVWSRLSRAHLVPLENSDAIFCVSRDTRQRLIEQANKLHERAIVVSNTFGAKFFPGDRILARKRFNLTNEYVILTVARLPAGDGYKGHDRVIKLLPELAGRASGPVVYLIAGVGEDRERLEKLSHKLGVAHLVRFLGKVPEAALPDLYRAADLFALPSTGEGFGIAFVEAMACGTPAIGLSVGGAPDALGDGALGQCVTSEMFNQAFLEAVEKDCERCPQLASKVHDRFGRHVFCAQIAGHFKKLMHAIA